jgi:histidinol-phosphatase
MADWTDELVAARRLADVGARIALQHFGHDPKTEKKADGTWVSEADRAAEAAIRLRIARDFPDHNILGEEEGLTAAGGGEPHDGAPTWIVDPIDGTNNFIAGIPIWATLVGLTVEEEPVVGAVSAPALNERYHGGLGLGSFFNDRPMAVTPIKDLSEATVCFASVKGFVEANLSGFFERLTATAWRSRGFGDFWGHMLVARGAVHAMVEPDLNTWDVAALHPIVHEAGGRLTHLDGSEWSGSGSCLTTCGRPLHSEIVALATETRSS